VCVCVVGEKSNLQQCSAPRSPVARSWYRRCYYYYRLLRHRTTREATRVKTTSPTERVHRHVGARNTKRETRNDSRHHHAEAKAPTQRKTTTKTPQNDVCSGGEVIITYGYGGILRASQRREGEMRVSKGGCVFLRRRAPIGPCGISHGDVTYSG